MALSPFHAWLAASLPAPGGPGTRVRGGLTGAPTLQPADVVALEKPSLPREVAGKPVMRPSVVG